MLAVRHGSSVPSQCASIWAAAAAAEPKTPYPDGRAVIAALAEREGWHPGYAFDGQKTLYAPTSWNHLVESTLRPFAVSSVAVAALQ